MNEQAKRTPLRKLQVAGALCMALLEAFVLVEILWYYLHDGESTLHGAVAAYWQDVQARVVEDDAVTETRDMIRDLPETDVPE